MQNRVVNGASVPRLQGTGARDLAALREYLVRAMEELRFLLDGVEKQLRESSAGSLAGSVKGLEKDVSGLQASVEGLSGELDEVSGDVDGLERAVARIPFGKVDAGSTSTVMTATVPGITALEDGAAAYIMNGVVTSASGWTLNVNGLGAKPVYNSMAASTRITTTFNVNYTFLFVYNSTRVEGGCWDMYYGYNSDTNTIAYNVRRNVSSGHPYTTLYRYQMLFSRRDNTILPVNAESNKTGPTKVLTTQSFDPWMPILYYSTTSTVQTTGAPNVSYIYLQHNSVDLRYSFNINLNTAPLVDNKPVYLVCVPQADGQVKLATTAVSADMPVALAQELPSSEDGNVYVYLGRAAGQYQLLLEMVHPIYEYKDGRVRPWAG